MPRVGVSYAGRALRVRNSLRQDGALEPLSSASGRALLWYSCGPTVYDDAHLGHARAYVSLDVLRRVVTRLCRTPVTYALGVTDVDDKIAARAAERAEPPRALARRYEARFFADLRALRVAPPSLVLRVTEHVPHLRRFVARLVDVGAAYAAGSDVYFSVASAGPRYAQLDPSRAAPQPPDHAPAPRPWARDGLRGEHKRDPRDFALWKGARDDDDNPHPDLVWDSPWGPGRPGWHVECSAMATAALGDRLDLHTGGIDLRFPHHTNELATAEAVLCCRRDPDAVVDRWANTWLHVGHLHIAGRKMSKSLKNFVTVREFLAAGGDADAFRVFCLLHHYASPVEYSEDRLKDATAFLQRARRFVEAARARGEDAGIDGRAFRPDCPAAEGLRLAVQAFSSNVADAITTDFDTPLAMSAVGKLVTAGNTALASGSNGTVSGACQLALLEAASEVDDFLSCLGVSVLKEDVVFDEERSVLTEKAALDALVEFRERIRACAKSNDLAGVFSECDGVRRRLEDVLGVKVSDVASGKSQWTRVDR